jgi:galactokinase
MSEAQKVFDAAIAVHSPGQLTAPLLHEVLAFPDIRRYVYGGKGVGSQGDGTAQFVARNAEDRQRAMERIAEAFPKMRCFPLTVRGGVHRYSYSQAEGKASSIPLAKSRRESIMAPQGAL